MNTYKITNITNQVGKREPKYNKPVNINYVNNMNKVVTKINPGESIYLTISQIPFSIQNLRIGGFIDIVEVSETHLKSLMKPKVVETIVTTIKDVVEIKHDIPVKRRSKSEENQSMD